MASTACHVQKIDACTLVVVVACIMCVRGKVTYTFCLLYSVQLYGTVYCLMSLKYIRAAPRQFVVKIIPVYNIAFGSLFTLPTKCEPLKKAISKANL